MLGGLGTDPDSDARQARTVASLISRTLQASLLIRTAGEVAPGPSSGPGSSSDRTGQSAVAEAFLNTRLGDAAPTVFGSSGSGQRLGADNRAVIARATVAPR
jgi:hypothetical protein